MHEINETPTFNLKAVVRETGVQPDTLRAWERRYGLPSPDRSAGGHRLYSQRDIEIVKWLIQRQAEGLRISRAVDLWKALESEGRDPLRMPEYASSAPGRVLPELDAGAPIADLRQSWVAACLAFDEARAEAVLSQAFALHTPETVCIELLQRGIGEIGQGWYAGEVSVQQEHFASELAMRRLETLVAAAPRPTRPARILIACPPEEDHTFAPLLLTLLLRRRGWDVIYLGANVPLEQLHATIESTRPNLLVATAQHLHAAATLSDMADHVLEQGVPTAYGGLIFIRMPELQQRISGFYLSDRIDQAPQIIEQILSSRRTPGRADPLEDSYQSALRHFREHQGHIEAGVWERLGNGEIARAHLIQANLTMGSNIYAALRLGDIDYLAPDFQWLTGLMVNYQIPEPQLQRYLEAYSASVQEHLDDAKGAIIQTWLREAVGAQFPRVGITG